MQGYTCLDQECVLKVERGEAMVMKATPRLWDLLKYYGKTRLGTFSVRVNYEGTLEDGHYIWTGGVQMPQGDERMQYIDLIGELAFVIGDAYREMIWIKI
jgi:hypothetical protein